MYKDKIMSINLTDEIEVKTKKGKLGAAKQIFLEGDTTSLQKEHEDNQAHFDTLDNRSTQMEKSIKDISVTGGASTANAVSYNNETSGMTAVTAQAAFDELAAKNKAQDATIATKAEKSEVATELDKKFDKESIAQESGEAEDKVMSQKAVSDKLSDLEGEICKYHFALPKMDGKFYNAGSGILQTGTSYIGTDMFAVSPNRKYQLLNYGTNTKIVYFDSSKKYINSTNISINIALGIFTTPENAAFAAITTIREDGIDYFQVVDVDYKDKGVFYLPFTTNTQTTRCLIEIPLRKQGLIISYKIDNEWVVEQFIGTASYLNDSAWGADNSWDRLAKTKDLPDLSDLPNLSDLPDFSNFAGSEQVYIQKKMDGKFYNPGSGNLQEGMGNTGTSMFTIIPNHIYSVYNYSIFSSRQFIWFDSSKKRIINVNIQSDKTTAPSNAAFAALTFDATTVWDNVIITDVTDIENLDAKISNDKFSISKWDGHSFNNGNGIEETGRTDRFSTRLISVKPGQKYRFVNASDFTSSRWVLFKTTDKTFISSLNIGADYLGFNVFVVPDNAAFMAFTIYEDFKEIYIEQVFDYWNTPLFLEYESSRQTTRIKVPKVLRRVGMLITYIENEVPIIEKFTNALKKEDFANNSFQLDANWVRLIDADSIKSFQLHPMNGKTFYCIGDSLRWAWCNKLAELTGAIYGGDIFENAISENEKYYQSRLVAQAKYLADLFKQGSNPVDYIFIEYVHSYFVGNVDAASKMFYCNDDITKSEPFLTGAWYDFTDQIFENETLAKNYWDSNFTTIVNKYTQKSNAIIALKTGKKAQKPIFKLSGSATKNGDFTIKFTSTSGSIYQMAITIEAGMTLNDALTKINEIEFADSGSKWANLNAHSAITDGKLKFTYIGQMSDEDSSIKMEFDFGTTGITYDGTWEIVTETTDYVRGFYSHDVSKWTDSTYWHELSQNFDSYKWCKAMVELLQKEIPRAKIYIFTMPFDMWDYSTNETSDGINLLYPDGTFNVQALYDSERHKRVEQNWKGWETVAKYYNLGFIPVGNMFNISPINNSTYYTSNNVHPTQEGYDRVAEILSENVY